MSGGLSALAGVTLHRGLSKTRINGVALINGGRVLVGALDCGFANAMLVRQFFAMFADSSI